LHHLPVFWEFSLGPTIGLATPLISGADSLAYRQPSGTSWIELELLQPRTAAVE
jgi:hypothetical protein